MDEARIKQIVKKAMANAVKDIDPTDRDYQALLKKAYDKLTDFLGEEFLDLISLARTQKDNQLVSQLTKWYDAVDDVKTAIGELQERKPIIGQYGNR